MQIDGDEWAVNDRLCAIHCTALDAADLAVLADRGASMVWSPLSNYLLYGRTADIVAAKQAGIPMCLGSDWAPSGSKNLLGELKVAALASAEHGGVFTARELAEMVTINPAKALKWDHLVGSIEPGKLADLVVLDGHDGDPFDQLVAREGELRRPRRHRRRAAGRSARPDAAVLGQLAHRSRLDRRDHRRPLRPASSTSSRTATCSTGCRSAPPSTRCATRWLGCPSSPSRSTAPSARPGPSRPAAR